MIKRILPAVLFVAAACSSGEPADTAPAGESSGTQPSPNSVEIRVFAYKPNDLTVPANTTVTWTNFDEINHTVTDGTPDGQSNGSIFDHEFDPAGGDSFEFTFTTPGTYRYFCTRHPVMTGTVVVNG